MGKSPAFQLYAADFYMDTIDWTATEIGVYFRLLMSEWVNGPLMNDTERLARIAGIDHGNFKKLWGRSVGGKFRENGHGTIINDRLEQTREMQANYIEKQKEKGKKSAEKRWGKPVTTVITTVMPVLQPEGNSSSSSSSSLKKENNKRKNLTDEEFISALKEKFPWIDFDFQMKKIDAWLLANPGRQKTRKFIVRWISNIEKPMEVKPAKSW